MLDWADALALANYLRLGDLWAVAVLGRRGGAIYCRVPGRGLVRCTCRADYHSLCALLNSL
jgi:hypothetical protein